MEKFYLENNDNSSYETKNEFLFLKALKDVVYKTQWLSFKHNQVKVMPLTSEKDIEEFKKNIPYGLVVENNEILDTIKNTKLYISLNGFNYLLRDTSIQGLLESAKLSGSSLSKLSKDDLCKILNLCLQTSSEKVSKFCLRGNKITAITSDKYIYLNPYILFDILSKYLQVEYSVNNGFDMGYLDYSFIKGVFVLSDLQQELIDTYEQSFTRCNIFCGDNKMKNLEPMIKLTTSDVGKLAVTISPTFFDKRKQIHIHIGQDIKLKHYAKTDIKDFSNALDDVFAMLICSAESIAQLSQIFLEYPVNTLKLLSNKAKLPKKTASNVIEKFTAMIEGGVIEKNAYEVFSALWEIISLCYNDEKFTPSICLDLEERVARLISINWNSYDICGDVKW